MLGCFSVLFCAKVVLIRRKAGGERVILLEGMYEKGQKMMKNGRNAA